MKKLIALIVVVVIAMTVIWYMGQKPPPEVLLHTVARGTVEQTVSNTRAGTVEACRRSKLSMPIGGRVDELLVEYPESPLVDQALLRGAELAAAGKAGFEMVCMACHGMDGKGNPALGAPNLTDDTWLYSSDPSDIEYAIRNGRNGEMPVFGNTLSEDHRRLLAAYVMGLSDS